jgi:Cse1
MCMNEHQLYVKLYPEMLARSQSVEAFVKKVWELVGGGKQLGVAYDHVFNTPSLNHHAYPYTGNSQLVSQSLRFISTAIRSGAYRDIFETRDTIQGLIAGVVVPNLALRTRDIESFEDSPLEYVRAELQVSEISTPRQAAADVVKALAGVGPETELATTTIVFEWISRALAEASQGGEYGWKSKDAAVYLFEAVATRSGTLAVRVLSLKLSASSTLMTFDASTARRDGNKPEREYRTVVCGQHIRRSSGRRQRCPPCSAGRCDQVSIHVPLSGMFRGLHESDRCVIACTLIRVLNSSQKNSWFPCCRCS